jgi:hypothetical protein
MLLTVVMPVFNEVSTINEIVSRVRGVWHTRANRFLTQLSNAFSDLDLTDMEACYKVFKRECIEDIQIEEKRFGVEPELTPKFARRGYRIHEVAISYTGRSYAEGKKIGWLVFPPGMSRCRSRPHPAPRRTIWLATAAQRCPFRSGPRPRGP